MPKPNLRLARKAATPERLLRTAPHRVRIIGGKWKRTPLVVSDALGLRPTPDRVRGTVFNWLTHLFGGSLAGTTVIDAFAGTGALGFEAASRAAARVLLVERSATLARVLEDTRIRLDAQDVCKIRVGDALAVLRDEGRAGTRYDMVFLDPPFGEGWIERTIPFAIEVLQPDGILYVEMEEAFSIELTDQYGLELLRADKAGKVFYHLLRRKMDKKLLETTPC